MKFLHSSLVKQVALDICRAQDRHLLAPDRHTADELAGALARLTRILTEQIATVIPTPTPQRAAMVQQAVYRYVLQAREYVDRAVFKNE